MGDDVCLYDAYAVTIAMDVLSALEGEKHSVGIPQKDAI